MIGEMSSSSWVLPESSAASELNLEEGDTLTSASCEYMVTELIGEGGFGQVVQCWNENSLEMVAVKVLKKDKMEGPQHELSILETISILDPDQTNLVRFFEGFEYRGHTCLVFEELGVDLFGLLERRDFRAMYLSEIRDVAEQLLVALDALKGLAIVHGDIKPDNAMLVSAKERPMRVKLVDFGTAVPTSQVYPGMTLQAIGYRAPEVCLGLPLNEAVDVWGAGCVLAFLYLGSNLFPVDCKYQMMRSIVQILGQPSDHQLSEGMYTKYFFTEEEEVDDDGPRWRLMTPEEYSAVNATPALEDDYLDFPGGLDDLMEVYPVLDDTEWEETAALVHLLKGLLHMDREQRLTPRAALQHPFITRSFLNQEPVNQEPLCGPSQEPLNGPSQESLNQEPLGSPSQEPLDQEPLNQEPLCGPSQEPLNLEPFSGPSQERLNQEPFGGPSHEPLNLEPLCGPSQERLNGPSQESLNQEPLGSPSQESLNQEPLGSPSQEPLDQEPLNQEPLCGPSQEPLNLEPFSGPSQERLNQEPFGGPSHEPLNLEPLCGPSQERLNGPSQESLNQEPLGSPSQEPLNLEPLGSPSQEPLNQEPLNQEPLCGPSQEPLNLEPLGSPSQEPLNQEPRTGPSQDQDSDSGLSELLGTFCGVTSTISVIEQRVDVEEEASGSCDETCGAKGAPLGSTSTSRFRRVRKAIRRVFKAVRNTLFCCLKPQVED